MGPVGAGAACCCATIDAPKITTAIAIGAPTDLPMFLSMICGGRNSPPRSLHPWAAHLRTHSGLKRTPRLPGATSAMQMTAFADRRSVARWCSACGYTPRDDDRAMAPGGVWMLGSRRACIRNRVDSAPYPSSRPHDRRSQHGHGRVHGWAGTRRRLGRPARIEAQPPASLVELRAARARGRARGFLDRRRRHSAHTRLRVGLRRGRIAFSLFDRAESPARSPCCWCRASRLVPRFRWPCEWPSLLKRGQAGQLAGYMARTQRVPQSARWQQASS